MPQFLLDHLLSFIIFTPALGALIILFLPRQSSGAIKVVAVIATLIPLLLCVPMMLDFDPNQGTREGETALTLNGGQFQFVEDVPWIDAFNVRYTVAVDGLSVTMVLLTAIMSFICIFASWNIEKWKINRGIKAYFALFLLLDCGMTGVFCALDFLLFYVFWELMLLPMYFLIGIWGGPRREYAAIKFFLYTLAGSVLMLVVMLALYWASGESFSMVDMMNRAQDGAFTGGVWKLAFIGLFIGFAIKVPVFPFHTWLPDAHVEAPTPVSVILAAVLLKMGVYGLLRISFPILPEATQWFAPVLMILGVINIIYGALCALAQIRGVPRVNMQTGEKIIERDWKKLIAYSSVSHMGFCLIGMAACTPAGLSGAVFQMFNHGCIAGMLFLLVGVIYDRAHHRDIQGFGGLMSVMPNWAVVTALAFMASLGLPGLSGFVSEVLCFVGAFQAGDPGATYFGFLPGGPFYKVLTAVSVLGIVLGAAYFLWSYEKVFLGPLNEKYADLEDMNVLEKFTVWPLAMIVVTLGILPFLYLNIVAPHMSALANLVNMPWIK